MNVTGLRAVLFDLDNTLVDEHQSVERAFAEACALAEHKHGLDPAPLEQAVREEARSLWHRAPEREYCARVGISSWEGLAATFEGEHESLSALRDWRETYRVRSWEAGLRRLGIEDGPLAVDMGRVFACARRSFHPLLPHARECVTSLAERYALGVVTNGASDLQRCKLAGSGLGDCFRAVVVGGEVGVGKPDRAVFEVALNRLGTGPGETVMVGDRLKNDVAGPQRVGVRAIWLDRGVPQPTAPAVEPAATVFDLRSVAALLLPAQ